MDILKVPSNIIRIQIVCYYFSECFITPILLKILETPEPRDTFSTFFLLKNKKLGLEPWGEDDDQRFFFFSLKKVKDFILFF
jgi:hypothetical protein